MGPGQRYVCLSDVIQLSICQMSFICQSVSCQMSFVVCILVGMIEKNCWAGLEDFFLHLSRALQAEGEENIPELKRKSRRKRRIHNIPRHSLEDTRLSECWFLVWKCPFYVRFFCL